MEFGAALLSAPAALSPCVPASLFPFLSSASTSVNQGGVFVGTPRGREEGDHWKESIRKPDVQGTRDMPGTSVLPLHGLRSDTGLWRSAARPVPRLRKKKRNGGHVSGGLRRRGRQTQQIRSRVQDVRVSRNPRSENPAPREDGETHRAAPRFSLKASART